MDLLYQLLEKVPYRYRHQVHRDVVEVVLVRDEKVWLPWTFCLATGCHAKEEEPSTLFCLQGKYIIPDMNMLVLPVDIFLPLKYPRQPPILRLHCADTLMDGDYWLVYASRTREYISITRNRSSTLALAIKQFFNDIRPCSLNTLIANQLHQAVRDNRPDIVSTLLEDDPMEYMAMAVARLNDNDEYDGSDNAAQAEQRLIEDSTLFVDHEDLHLHINSLLQVAVEAGNIDMMQFLMESDDCAAVKKSVKLSKSLSAAFDLPVWHGHSMLIRDIVSVGVTKGKQEDRLFSLVTAAATHGHVYTLRALAESGTPVTLPGLVNKMTNMPLHIASTDGDVYFVQELLELGVDVNQVDIQGCTALHCAARLGHTDVLLSLLRAGADMTIADKNGLTAVYYAAASQLYDTSALSLLLCAAMTDVNDIHTPDSGRTLLMHAVHEKAHKRVLQVLLEAGAEVEAVDDHGRTALHYAVTWIQPVYVDVLLKARASILYQNAQGNNAVMLAAMSSHTATGKLQLYVLLSHPDATSAVRAVNHLGETVLHLVCNLLARNVLDARVVERLMAAGADARVRDQQGRTATDIARATGLCRNQVIVDILTGTSTDI